MAIRETLAKHKAWIAPVILVIGIAAAAVSLWKQADADKLPGPVNRVFYTDDDGKTYFPDEINKPTPFEHNGKVAYRAFVYRCGSGAPFVGLIGRQTADPRAKPAPANAHFKSDTIQQMEVRKPGQTNWISFNTPEGMKLAKSLCPDGVPDVVLP